MFTNGNFRCKAVIKIPPAAAAVRRLARLCLVPLPPSFVSRFMCHGASPGAQRQLGDARASFGVCLSSSGREMSLVTGLEWCPGLGVGCGSAVPALRSPAGARMDLLPFAISQTIRMLLNPSRSPKAGLLVEPCFLWNYDLCGHQAGP